MAINAKRWPGAYDERQMRQNSGLRNKQHHAVCISNQVALVNGAGVGTSGQAQITDFDLPFASLKCASQPANGETVTIGGKVYTFRTAITATLDGDVLRGANTTEALQNLQAAINNGIAPVAGGAGLAYGSGTPKSTTVTALVPVTNTQLSITAIKKTRYDRPASATVDYGPFPITIAEGLAGGTWEGPGGSVITAMRRPILPLGSSSIPGNRVQFPATLCIDVNQGTPSACVLQFRIRGFDQFGQYQEEITPVITLAAKTDNWIYCSKVFAWVNEIAYLGTLLSSIDATINVGTRFDWVRTIDAGNQHIGGENLGIGLPMTLAYRGAGSTRSAHFRMNQDLTPAAKYASNGLTLTTVNAGDTVTINGKVYTFANPITSGDGQVLRTGTLATDVANLAKAINLVGVAGTDYGANTTKHPTVQVQTYSGTAIIVQAIEPGSLGNLLTTTQTLTAGAWNNTTLTGGVSGNGELGLLTCIPWTTTLAQTELDYVQPQDFEIGRFAAGWTPSLEKVSILRAGAVPLWLFNRNYSVWLSMRTDEDV